MTCDEVKKMFVGSSYVDGQFTKPSNDTQNEENDLFNHNPDNLK